MNICRQFTVQEHWDSWTMQLFRGRFSNLLTIQKLNFNAQHNLKYKHFLRHFFPDPKHYFILHLYCSIYTFIIHYFEGHRPVRQLCGENHWDDASEHRQRGSEDDPGEPGHALRGSGWVHQRRGGAGPCLTGRVDTRVYFVQNSREFRAKRVLYFAKKYSLFREICVSRNWLLECETNFCKIGLACWTKNTVPFM